MYRSRTKIAWSRIGQYAGRNQLGVYSCLGFHILFFSLRVMYFPAIAKVADHAQRLLIFLVRFPTINTNRYWIAMPKTYRTTSRNFDFPFAPERVGGT
jgi:hypothetical protein